MSDHNAPPQELFGVYGRLPTAALKIALILASLDWDGQSNVPTIQPANWYRAQLITEKWRVGAHLLYRELSGVSELDTLEQHVLGAVLRRIAKTGKCNRRDVYRNLSKKQEQINPVIDSMIEAGLLTEVMIEGHHKPFLEPGDGLPPAFVSKR